MTDRIDPRERVLLGSEEWGQALRRLIVGLPAPAWACRLLLCISPDDNFTTQRMKYRATVQCCCKKSGTYQPELFRMLRTAWRCLWRDRW